MSELGVASTANFPDPEPKRCAALHPGYPANRCERPVGHSGDHHVTTLRTKSMKLGPSKWPDPEGGAA